MKRQAIILILLLTFYVVKVTAQTCTLTSGSDNQTVCINSAITDIKYSLTGSTSATVTGLPSGVSYSFSSPEVTISGTPTESGIFNYIVTLTDGTTPCTSNGTITVTALPGASGGISGTATVCQSQSGVSYSVGAITGATSYTWTYSGTGATINGTTNSVTINFTTNATSGNLTVYGVNSCGNGTVSTNYAITVNPLPAAAGPITGTSGVCQGQSGVSYSVGAIANATSYSWSYSGTGASIVGTTNSVTINFAGNATSGNLTVRGVNSCGNGTASAAYAITVHSRPVPLISGPDKACITSTTIYTTDTGMSGYAWTLPSGGSLIPSGNTATVTWNSTPNSSRTVTVSYTDGNGCTAVSPTTKIVNVIAKPIPGNVVISGIAREYATLTVSYNYDPDVCFPEDLSQTLISWYWYNNATGGGRHFIATKTGLDKTFTVPDNIDGKYVEAVVELHDGTELFGEVESNVRVGPVAANEKPTATPLSITGIYLVNNMLTGNYNYADAENDPQSGTTFEWWRDDDGSGPGTKITGATGQTYTLTTSDREKFINFKVIPGASRGTTPGDQVETGWTGPVSDHAPVASSVTISGTPIKAGKVLIGSYQYSDAEGDTESNSTYQWYTGTNSSGAGSTPIDGATSISYLLKNTEIGFYIGFSVKPAALDGISPGTMVTTTTWVGPVTNDAPVATINPITGSLNVGGLLRGNYVYSDAEGDLEGGSTYQWYSYDPKSGGTFNPITGETGISHIITLGEQGYFFKFSVTPVAQSGTANGSPATSPQYGPANSKPVATNVQLSGTPSIGSTLTGSYTFSDPDPGDTQGTSTFRWLRNGTTAIPGATSLTYLVTAADEGFNLSFEVTPVSSTGFPNTGTPVQSPQTSAVIDPSPLTPVAEQVCITGYRKKNEVLAGRYYYNFYKTEGTSTYRWLKNNVAIPGATGITYTLREEDVAAGQEITFEVTPVSSNFIPKVGTAVKSDPLARIKLEKTNYSIADPSFILAGNVPGGLFSGRGVSAGQFSPAIADTTGSPHKITYLVNILNINTTCVQQAYDSIYILPINAYFVGLENIYCFTDKPDTISVANVPDEAVNLRFYSPNKSLIIDSISPKKVVIDPAGKRQDVDTDTLYFSFTYKGSYFPFYGTFLIDYIEPAVINNLSAGDVYCNNSEPFTLYPNLTGPEGVFSGPVNGNQFNPSLGSGSTSVVFTYTNSKTGCYRTVNVPITIYPAPKPVFKPVSACIITLGKDSTQFINLTTSEEPVATWNWEFFDAGGSSTNTRMNPAYPFTQGGQHRVTLRATTIHQCYTIKDSTIDIGVKPVPNFTWKDECYNPDSPDYIWFYDATKATSTIKSQIWDFFDGKPQQNNDTAKYLKNSSGYLSVKLKVETNYKNCADSILRQIYIRPTYSLATKDYSQDFEGGNGGWVKDYEPNNNWAFGTPDRSYIDSAASGINSWYTRYILNNQDAENSSVISPCFDFNSVGRPMIVMNIWKRFNRNHDGVALQYKIGDDQNWQHVGTLEDGINWYNSSLIKGKPGGEQIGWTTLNEPDSGYVLSVHTLDELLGKSDVKFRIAYGSDGTYSDNDGFAFDDIWIGERSRNVLLEHFTNVTNSTSANSQVNKFVSNRGKDVINIQYHTNFPKGDPYYSDNPGDASARFLFYGLVKAPFTFTDGGTGNYFAYVNDYSKPELDTISIIRRSLIPPSFNITVNSSVSGGILNISGVIKAIKDLDEGNLTCYLAVTERKNSRHPVTGEPDFYKVFRKFIPDAAGISLKKTWIKNETLNIPVKSWTIEKIPTSSDIEVIAFIQNNITKEVYQAASNINKNVSVGIETLRSADGNGFSLYPNPASGKLTIAFEKPLQSEADIRIYNFSGTLIRSFRARSMETEFTVEDLGLKNGIYLVRISSGGLDYGFKKLIISGR